MYVSLHPDQYFTQYVNLFKQIQNIDITRNNIFLINITQLPGGIQGWTRNTQRSLVRRRIAIKVHLTGKPSFIFRTIIQ